MLRFKFNLASKRGPTPHPVKRCRFGSMNRDGIQPWWRHQMETFSTSLTLCAGNSPITGEFPSQSPVTRSFDVFFDLRLNKRLSKQSWDWWFETPSCLLWRHCNDHVCTYEALWYLWKSRRWFYMCHFISGIVFRIISFGCTIGCCYGTLQYTVR